MQSLFLHNINLSVNSSQICSAALCGNSLLTSSVCCCSGRMLQEDPVLFQLYKDLVVSQVISADEFWANRLGGTNNGEPAPYNNKQEVGISGAFLVSTSNMIHNYFMLPYDSFEYIKKKNCCTVFALQADIRPQTDGCNGLRYNLTADIIESIFRTYPAGKQKRCLVKVSTPLGFFLFCLFTIINFNFKLLGFDALDQNNNGRKGLSRFLTNKNLKGVAFICNQLLWFAQLPFITVKAAVLFW